MTHALSRRRFLSVSAAIAMIPSAAAASIPVARWQGVALGAGASMQLVGLSDTEAAPIFAQIEQEVSRLENIFSLYRENSVLSQLNRLGAIDNPPSELLELLSIASTIHSATDGAFDPTIQPLWALYAGAASEGKSPSAAEISDTRAYVGWKKLYFDSTLVRFEQTGMALTLNGIAQGYITDRVAALLRAHGFDNVMINMGEISALGNRLDGMPWLAGIVTPDGALVGQIELKNRALATSATLGTVLDGTGKLGHIIDPKSGRPGNAHRLVSVSADRAVLADGLSTAFSMMPLNVINKILPAFDNARLEINV
ncbi:MAG: FAD:protein FMN transferase [Amylibacter sp.]|nr:FAD:protein FMN transferase [Amylibacter sp.]